MNCINTKSKEFQELLEASKLPSLLLEMRVAKWQEQNGLESFPKVEDIIQSQEVNFTLKSIDILQSDKAKQVFDKGKKANWDLNKILTELQVPKEQKQLLLDLGITDREQLALELANNYSYSVEINTAKENLKPIIKQENITKEIFESINVEPEFDGDPESYSYIKETPEAIYYATFNSEGEEYYTKSVKGEQNNNSSYYSNLTVPGGTNYTEQEIATPLITPSIKGHAQFSTDNGIGWFRSDDKVKNDENQISLGKELSYDDPYISTSRKKDFKKYEVLNENGNSIGTVIIEHRGHKSVILHPKLDVVGKGYGKKLYKHISSKFDVQIEEWNEGAISNSSSAKKMWDSLEKEGSAKRIFDEEQGYNFRVLTYSAKNTKTRRILEVQSDWGQKQRKSAEPDINIKYDIQQIINGLQKSGDLKIDCN